MLQRDRIVLEGLTFYGYHGCAEAEARLGQRFVVDLAVTLDLSTAGTTDDLTKTVDYSAVFAVVRSIVEGPRHNLLETVAERIARAILESGASAPVASVWVRVTKPQAPIKGMNVGSVSVEITRP